MSTPAMKQLQRQDDLRQQLGRLQPTLAHLYEHCLQILPRYDDGASDARATLAFLAHGVRELVNSIPDMLNATDVTSHSQEQKALAELRIELMAHEPIAIPLCNTEHVSIPVSVAVALQKYQQELATGTNTAAGRMAAVFLGESKMRGGSLVAFREAARFFMHWVHIDRSEESILPSRSKVQGAFEVIETSLLARLGDFFDAKERMRAFVNQSNERSPDGSFTVPDDDEVRYGLSLAADPRLAPLFFAWLENPNWMKKLAQRKALTDLSTSDTTGSWPEYPYLIRMASIAPDDVCVALSTAGPQSPSLVRRAVLECASKMPAEYSARLVDTLFLWTGDDATLEDWCWQQEHLSSLFAIVLQNHQTRKSGRKLLDSLYRPRPTSAQDKDRPYYGSFASLIHSCVYAESLSDSLRYLPARIQVGTLASYLQTIESSWSYHGTSQTSFFIPSINDAAQGGKSDIGKQLARLICLPLRTLLNTGDNTFEKRLLDCQWHLVQRAAMYVLSQAIPESQGEEAQRLCALAGKAFLLPTILDGDYDPELFPLVRVAKQHNPDLSLHGLLSRLDETASRREERFLKNQHSCVATDAQEAKRLGRTWKHRALSLIGKEYLDGDVLQEFLKLEEEFGPRDYDERHVSAIECSWGPSSPIGIDEMQAMDPKELLAYLGSSHFDAKDLFDMKSHRGQGHVLKELIQRQPDVFLGMAREISFLRPTYISSILSGWAKAIGEGMSVDVTTCIDVCERLSHIPDGEQFPAEGDRMDDDADYDSARLEAVRLLDALLSHKQACEIESCRDRILEILISFSNSALPEENDAPDDATIALFNSAVTNRAMDYDFGEVTVRKLFEYGPRISPLNKSKLSNHLGYNAFVITADGCVPFVVRSKELSIGKLTLGCSIGASVKSKYALCRESGEFSPKGLLNSVINEIQDELKVKPSDIIGTPQIIAPYRDLLEGGKPQLCICAHTSLDKEALRKQFKRGVSKKPKGGLPPDAELLEDGTVIVWVSAKDLREAAVTPGFLFVAGEKYAMLPSMAASVALLVKSGLLNEERG